MAQTDPAPAFNQTLVERAIAYLHTGDTALFPFAAKFDDERRRAFARDLQVALADLTESGSKRGTAASGFLVSDRRLQETVMEWAAADGDWPAGSNPTVAYTSLAAVVRPDTGEYDDEAMTQSERSAI